MWYLYGSPVPPWMEGRDSGELLDSRRRRDERGRCHFYWFARGLCSCAECAPITINPTFSGFDATQEDVIQAAINRWITMVGGHEIDIGFTATSDVLLASTSDWVADNQGRPASAAISVNAAEYDWTTGDPAEGQIDAMRGMMHEIAHAVGWTVALDSFASNVARAGANRFYDLDHDGAYNAGTDFDLTDSAWEGTHAPDGSGDLMQPYAPVGARLYPTYQHAGVLTDAFDYSVVIDGLGGDAGYGDFAMGRSDDGSSSLLDLPFEINFFGASYDSFFVNNNGNVSFETTIAGYTPETFPVADQPMIAPSGPMSILGHRTAARSMWLRPIPTSWL